MASLPPGPSAPPGPAKEMTVKELTRDEVLAIAGGLPPGASLDEILYRTPAEPIRDPMVFAALAADEGHAPAPD